MNLDSYSIQELENIDFRSQFGKKLKSEMGISSQEIKKKILEIIDKKKQDQLKNESLDYQDMIKLLPDKFINIRKSHFQIKDDQDGLSDTKLEEVDTELIEVEEESCDNIDLTMESDDEIDNIDFTEERDSNRNEPNFSNNINLKDGVNKISNIKTVETETNSVNYIVQLFNQDETVQLKLTRDQFINFAINNGYSQDFIVDFLNQGNKNNVCKIDEFQWLNDDFLSKLRNVLEDLPLFFDSELCLESDEERKDLYDDIYKSILDSIEENKRRNIEELREMNSEQLETLKNQYSTINTIEERLKNRFSEYVNRDMLTECDLLRETEFYNMINDLESISDLRIRGFITHYRFDCIHNRQRNVIDKIVRILIPPPKGFKT
tara:strand:+ start:355 stop:1488 length:1134 start_codon:yes stop_codon:yes gene_type:complete